MNGFRVIMTVTNEVSPELYAALKEVPPRLRAERVRTLAAIGLTAVSGSGVPSKTAASGCEPVVMDKASSTGPARAVSFAKSIVGGV